MAVSHVCHVTTCGETECEHITRTLRTEASTSYSAGRRERYSGSFPASEPPLTDCRRTAARRPACGFARSDAEEEQESPTMRNREAIVEDGHHHRFFWPSSYRSGHASGMARNDGGVCPGIGREGSRYYDVRTRCTFEYMILMIYT